MSLGTHSLGPGRHRESVPLRHHGSSLVLALMVATSAMATYDLYLFALSAIH